MPPKTEEAEGSNPFSSTRFPTTYVIFIFGITESRFAGRLASKALR
jgi:hypothetical protein